MSTATQNETISEIRDFFRTAYVEELRDRLAVYADGDTLEKVIDGDYIDGGLLSGCDEAAAEQVKQHFSWRVGEETIDEAIERPEVYDGIDYPALIREARAKVTV